MEQTPLAPASAPGPELLFDAILKPHRSLGEPGFLVLMAAVGLVSFGAGLAFLLLGAWPVFGFFGLDAALVYLAFRLNYRAARLIETVRLTREALVVERISPKGAVRSWSFQPYWLRVDLAHPGEHHSRVELRSHGRVLTLGAFLSPGERVAFAEALKVALRRCRCVPAPAC